ncbi:Uncharacterised protein [uncultured archaeon]|nr:Uncharacterised protein [uncultured archaeon]
MKLLLAVAISLCLLLFGCTGGSYPPASEHCVDGTIPGTCSSTAPHYCTSDKQLIDEADLCGCPASEVPSGSVCVPG